MGELEDQLQSACENGDIEVIKLLLNDDKIEVNQRKVDNNGWTPFYTACQYGYIEIVKLLLNDKRVDVNKAGSPLGGKTPLWIACFNEHLEVVKLLINDSRVKVNEPSYDGETPFYIVCGLGKIDIVKLLLKNEKVDVNKVCIRDHTPFFVACQDGWIEVVKILLNDKRIDINKANKFGRTPFWIGCARGYIEVVKYILVSGRDVNLNVKDNDGKTPMDVAREKGKVKKVRIQREDEEHYQVRKTNCPKIVELLEYFESNPNETRTKRLLYGKKILFLFYFFFISFEYFFLKYDFSSSFFQLLEGYDLFRKSLEFGENEESITILKTATTFIGIEPTYFLPLNSKSQNQITHLFINNTTLDSIPISFDSFQSLIHLDLSNNKINDKNIQVISDLIQKSKEIVLIDLRSNLLYFLFPLSK